MRTELAVNRALNGLGGGGSSFGDTLPPWGYLTSPLTFGEKFRRYTADLLKLQGDQILIEKRRRGWTGDYPDGGTRMYLLEPDRGYLVVQVVAGCVWVPEDWIWAPEVFLVGEGY